LPPPPPPLRSRSSKKHLSLGRRLLRRVRNFLLITFASGTLLVLGILWYFTQDLPRIQDIFVSYRRPCIRIFDQKKNLLATYGDVYGEMISVGKLPAYVPQALMAIEDKRFYQHFGIDFIGVLRALLVNYRSGGVVQGGSTITQQLGKNILQAHKIYKPTDRSMRRKIQETLLALLLEMRLTKNQIMTLYLNRVYFGTGAFGVDAAAKRYFGRSAEKLTLYESALLMGLLKAPSRYSPAHNSEKSEMRAKQVLLKMVEAGFITQSAMETALMMASPAPDVVNTSAVHYFTDWVVEQLPALVSLNQDLDVLTTLDLSCQEKGEAAVSQVMEKHARKWGADQLALVAMTRDGAVKAMVGGVSYARTQFNRVTQALRQPGSLFKFFTYLTALEQGLDPNHLIEDSEFEIGSWAPRNYKYTPKGHVTLREAFAKSVNAAAIRLAMLVGFESVMKTVRKLGVKASIPHNLSVTLGAAEMTLLETTGAFAAVLNKGYRVEPHGIMAIRNKEGHVIYRWKPLEERVISTRSVNGMIELLSAVVQSGTGHRARMERATACKTGTSQHYRDLWMVGFTPELVTGVWCGRDSDKPMTWTKGGSPSAHLWREFTLAAHKRLPVSSFRKISESDTFVPVIREDTNDAAQALSSPFADQTGHLDEAFGGWEKSTSYEEEGGAGWQDTGARAFVSTEGGSIEKSPSHPLFEDVIGNLLESTEVATSDANAAIRDADVVESDTMNPKEASASEDGSENT